MENSTMVFPRQVDIEVSDICQLRCKGCPFTFQEGKGGFMKMDLWNSIVDRIVKEREDCGWNPVAVNWLNGEPLLHPNYVEMTQRLVKENISNYTTTNGLIWNEDFFQLITQKNSVYQIIFSLDGLPHSFSHSIEKARPGSDRERILSTIRRFADLKIKNGNNLDMAVKIVHRGQDYEEIEEYIYYWLNQPGIDYVCVGKMLDEDTVDDMRIYPCRYSDPMFMVIKRDGDIVPCSYNNSATNERWFQKNMNWPNVRNDTPLLELYNSEPLKRFRKDQQERVFYGPCQRCGFAYTGHGMRGEIQFRDPKKQQGFHIYYRSDYYNQFFSFKDSAKPDSFYEYRS